ncbi:Eco47II family restriction endonuclease [Xenorhabdus bovienii]|uniref:Eco47II family restriction endonuclease n=1 Tax=Xenorhabdus bovienii TaxID=40576 RepID=UPI0023B31305|nr:Eco47II family restriction endonuclease [Xenorhabdus bovienii]MDE9544542.1 Eco47II family restriction endonuclease [Xenorhabdus bovienii]MDE9550740.1 Eco47II family restriction endonuclease [Xenorhabdus bovienii]
MKAFNRQALKDAIRSDIKSVYVAQQEELDLYRNTLDCFSAAIDSLVQGINLDDWLRQEKVRQIQKTKQNAIGLIHEKIMGSVEGLENLPVGNLIDIVSEKFKIVAEIKNKHNTTKGNHKAQIYRDLAKAIENKPGYIGYYVEVLPKGRKVYNEPFTPSDNQEKTRLPTREDIRIIDGKSFYAFITGYDDAIYELYNELPKLISEIIEEDFGQKLDFDIIVSSEEFLYNYSKAYGDD